jgi:hypothetical protein
MVVDTTDLIYAKRMIMGRSSFSLAALWLSPWQKAFYTIAQSRGRLGEHIECLPMVVLWHTMTNNWTASSEQLKRMVAYRCNRWPFEK